MNYDNFISVTSILCWHIGNSYFSTSKIQPDLCAKLMGPTTDAENQL